MDSNFKQLPMIALRGRVFFPNKKVSFEVSRKKSVAALETALKSGSFIFFAAQKNAEKEEISNDDIYKIGVVGKIEQILKIPGGIVKVFAECFGKFEIKNFNENEKYFSVDVEEVLDLEISEEEKEGVKYRAFLKTMLETFDEYARVAKIGPEFIMDIISSEDIEYISYSLAEKVPFKICDKQNILEEREIFERGTKVLTSLDNEIKISNLKQEIYTKVRTKIEKTQREYFLREEIKFIQEELGESDGILAEVKEYTQRMEDFKNMPQNVKKRLEKEILRLKKMSSSSAEGTVSRDYIELLLEMPWGVFDEEKNDLKNAWKILENDHYGLKEVKERIVEFLAVRKISNEINSPIICLVGPPGVGKTSIAKSVAKALNRKYARMSLGGISDEAEIRGHRKTYVGAMPGRIVSAIKNSKTMNPLILFDEIDKIRNERKGDPSAALLEVLDGEQNFSFRDNYLEIPLDISKVLFMCTANSVEDIPVPLRDRLEIINLGSYTHEEKLNIAVKYLVPKQIEKNGLSKKQIKFSKEVISEIISGYTREAGVRNLERLIGKVCRKAAKMIVTEEKELVSVKKSEIEQFLGARKFKDEFADKNDKVGVVRGLAWTRVGGDTLSIETVVMKGKGNFKLTGNVGKVMEESAGAAISYIRANCDKFDISKEFYENTDIHIHIPDGAVPKDGPSAGITMALSVISALTKKPVRYDVAMTGEITVTGRVLAIGGLKEKLIAAKMFGIKKVILPFENEGDYSEVPDFAKEGMEVVFVKNIEEVVRESLLNS